MVRCGWIGTGMIPRKEEPGRLGMDPGGIWWSGGGEGQTPSNLRFGLIWLGVALSLSLYIYIYI